MSSNIRTARLDIAFSGAVPFQVFAPEDVVHPFGNYAAPAGRTHDPVPLYPSQIAGSSRISMQGPSTSMRDLAKRLLAASQSASEPRMHGAVQVSEKLRLSLSRFAGAEGFASLQRRALALAKTEVPALQSITIGADGRLEGLEQLDLVAGGSESEAAVTLTSHLLGLFVTFIGEPYTRRLVQEAWPELSLDGSQSRIEDAG